jgi:hypothetical protein
MLLHFNNFMKHLKRYNENIENNNLEINNQIDDFINDLNDEFDIVRTTLNEISFREFCVVKIYLFNRPILKNNIKNLGDYRDMISINNYVLNMIESINTYLDKSVEFELGSSFLNYKFKCNEKICEFLSNINNETYSIESPSGIKLSIYDNFFKLNDDFSLEVKVGLKSWIREFNSTKDILNEINEEFSKFGFRIIGGIDRGIITMYHPNII